MSYEIVVSATNQTVTANTTELAVTVSAPATPTFTITNAVNSLTFATTLQTATIYTDAVELVLADLNDFWKGEWNAGTTYYRGDIVEFNYSQYFLKIWNPDVNVGYVSNTLPPLDSNWQRFNWHQAPFDVFTSTGIATFDGPIIANSTVDITGAVNAGGGLTVASTATFNGRLISNSQATFTTATFNTATIRLARIQDLVLGGGADGQGLVVNSTATFNGLSNFNGLLNINNLSTFNGTATFNKPVVLNSTFDVYNAASFYGPVFFGTPTVSIPNLTVTNVLRVQEKFIYNGLEYPKDKGLFGQVLYTNGATKADWVNLGELVFWSLSNDLYTNGFDIFTNALNQDLGIGVSTSSNFTNSPSYAKFYQTGNTEIVANNEGTIRANAAQYIRGYNNAATRSNLALGNDSAEISLGTNGLRNRILLQGKKITVGGLDPGGSTDILNTTTFFEKVLLSGNGITFGDGSVQTTAYTGGGGGGGVTSITAGTGTYISTSTGNVLIWTTSTGGGGGTTYDFFAGNGLDVALTGTSVTYTLNTATNSALGGIKVGANLNITADGVLSANTSTPMGTISLTEDMETNGYAIRYSDTYPNTKILLETYTAGDTVGRITLQARQQGTFNFDSSAILETNSFAINIRGVGYTIGNGAASYVNWPGFTSASSGADTDIGSSGNRLKLLGGAVSLTGNGSVTISSSPSSITVTPSNITLATTSTGTVNILNTLTIGSDSNNSTLRVQRIYNYAGNYAPFFPAGVQYQDNTVQFTAYQPDQGLL